MKKNDDERRCVILVKMKKNVQNMSIDDSGKNPNARRWRLKYESFSQVQISVSEIEFLKGKEINSTFEA